MSGAERYRRILSALLPAGVFGMSILLGSAGAQAAREIPAEPPSGAAPPRVAERLAAIRDAVTDVTALDSKAAPAPEGTERLAWHNGWFNGGWHNGWKNWGNGWKNGWNNWGNGWKNWGNGWKNGLWLNF